MLYRTPITTEPAELSPLNRGKIYPITNVEEAGVTGIPASSVVGDVFIQAVPLEGKEYLTKAPYMVRGGNGPTVLTGGQDVVGAGLFDRGRFQAILVAADGCSFVEGSEEAARIAVMLFWLKPLD